MNSPKVREAMRIVSKQLRAMDPAELRRQIDTHRGGPLSRQLIDSGMFEAREAEAAELLPARAGGCGSTRSARFLVGDGSSLEQCARLEQSPRH